MFRSDVLVLAELASCRLVDDQGPRHNLSCVSPAVRPLAERLLAASPHQRQAIWDQFLAGCAACSSIMPVAPVPGCAPNVAISAPVPLNSTAHVPVGPASERGVRMTRAVDFEPREIEWLWTGRVPLGMMTLFAGDPKLGKASVTPGHGCGGPVAAGLPLPTRRSCQTGRGAPSSMQRPRTTRRGRSCLVSAPPGPTWRRCTSSSRSSWTMPTRHCADACARSTSVLITSAAARLGDLPADGHLTRSQPISRGSTTIAIPPCAEC